MGKMKKEKSKLKSFSNRKTPKAMVVRGEW